jgi:hypothetical protein
MNRLLPLLLLLTTPAFGAAPQHGAALPFSISSNHDGDTLTGTITFRVNVRLCGDGKRQCWAKELNEPGGPESQKNLEKASNGKSGTLWIPADNATNLGNLFTFGRIVGDVWVDGMDESLSEYQVRTGHASTRKGGTPGQ